MRRLVLLIVLSLVLAFLIRRKDELLKKANVAQRMPAVSAPDEKLLATPVTESEESEAIVPTFIPQSKVLASVSDPPDAEGRQRVIESVETGMREPYVRVVKILVAGSAQIESEVAMVANQLLLEKPADLTSGVFVELLKSAGAVNVKAVGEAYLATFTARPEDPRALDGFMARVHEVAGADINVEPNYIRKMF